MGENTEYIRMSYGPLVRTPEYLLLCCVSLGKPLPPLGLFHRGRGNWMSRSQSLLFLLRLLGRLKTRPLKRRAQEKTKKNQQKNPTLC